MSIFHQNVQFGHVLIRNIYSQNDPVSADDWSGFESYAPSTTATTTTNNSRRPSKKVSTDNDFGGLDVKSSKSKPGLAGSVKKPEDDAWDLLNN